MHFVRLGAFSIFFAGVALAAPYQDTQLPIAERVRDLLSRMTTAEKLSQVGWESPAIPRFGLEPYNWSNECLHGVAAPGYSTVFPQAIGLAAGWSAPLHERVASAIADEARGHNNEFLRQRNYTLHTGLTCWSPNINIFRDPRWGRGQETYGEDPYLAGRLGAAFVKGLQGDDPRYWKTIATPKHFAVHSGPESQRHTFDAVVDDTDLDQTYLPQFREALSAGAGSVMCAYNRLRGLPACASPYLLQDVLRGRFGFGGYVVSDCAAVSDINGGHQYVKTPVEAAALAFNVGTDLACGEEYRFLPEAEQRGLVSSSRIDEAVGRLMTARMRLGHFDPPAMVAYRQIPFSVVDSPAHDELALRSARESLVLLKNKGGLLPFSKTLTSVAVIGPNAVNVDALIGNYSGQPSHPVTLLDGIRRKIGAAKVRYAPGSQLVAGYAYTPGSLQAEMLFHEERGQLVRGLRAEYFQGIELKGSPVAAKIEPYIDVDFQKLVPPAPLGLENFSVRWTGVLVPATSGEYLLGTVSDDGSRLFLDEQPLVDQWGDHGPSTKTAKVTLQAGKPYRLRVEYYQHGGTGSVSLVVGFADEKTLLREAVAAASAADAVVLGLGLSPRIEGEEMPLQLDGFEAGDRTKIELPAAQATLLRDVLALGKPTVLVLMNGGAIAFDQASVPAVLEAWYPGQRGGDAIADVLFGDYNPGGRLPVTFYRSEKDLPPFTDYAMAGRTYRFFAGDVLYPFGYGLSYTSFRYTNLTTNKQGDKVRVAVNVTNTGKRAGDEVVQTYVAPVKREGRDPIRTLAAFRRVHLQAGETQRLELEVKAAGPHSISIGGKQPGFQGTADASTTQVLTTTVP